MTRRGLFQLFGAAIAAPVLPKPGGRYDFRRETVDGVPIELIQHWDRVTITWGSQDFQEQMNRYYSEVTEGLRAKWEMAANRFDQQLAELAKERSA